MAKPSLAVADAGLFEAVRQFGEPATALELEETIVDLVRTQDHTGLQRLAEQIDQKDGNVLEAIAGVAQGTASADDPDMTRIALSLGPCHYANVLVRDVAFVIAEGSEAIIRNGVVDVDGTQVDEMYAQMMTDCERLKGHPARTVRIGLP